MNHNNDKLAEKMLVLFYTFSSFSQTIEIAAIKRALSLYYLTQSFLHGDTDDIVICVEKGNIEISNFDAVLEEFTEKEYITLKDDSISVQASCIAYVQSMFTDTGGDFQSMYKQMKPFVLLLKSKKAASGFTNFFSEPGLDVLASTKTSKAGVLFAAGYFEYARESSCADECLLRPLAEPLLLHAEEQRCISVDERRTAQLYVQTFGNFEVFSRGIPLVFARKKTKELLAYLIIRRGALCTVGEIMGVIWAQDKHTRSQGQFRNLVSDLVAALKAVQMESILIKQRGSLGVRAEQLSCDYYEYIRGSTQVVARYAGELMSQYEWAEAFNAYLAKEKQ